MAKPLRLASVGSGCPYCANQKVSGTNSLAALFPEIAAEWHPTRNGELTPADVVAGSNKKAWWKCAQGPDHEWQATLSNRTRLGRGCPRCAGMWPIDSLRTYVESLLPHLDALESPPAGNHTAVDRRAPR